MIRKNNGLKLEYMCCETSSDKSHEELSVIAIKKLLGNGDISEKDIGVLIYVTQTPRFMTPSTTFYVHKEVGLTTDCFQFDVNLGGTGFVSGVQLALSLLQGFNENCKKALLITGDNCVKCEDKDSNYSVITVISSSEDCAYYTINKNYGIEYKKYYEDEKSNYFDDPRDILLDRQMKVIDDFRNLEEEWNSLNGIIINAYETKTGMKGLHQLEQVHCSSYKGFNSSIWLPYFLYNNKVCGKYLLLSSGAGLAIAGMLCDIGKNVYR